MGADTKIQWAHSTFNPWRGCTKVSPGCDHCYAETLSKRNPKVLGVWGDDGKRVVGTDSYWRGPILWNRKAKETGERHRVFCASLADVFEYRPELVNPRERLWDTIYRTPTLDWLLLTKRPENISRMLPPSWVNEMPAPNVWLGTTVEDQQRADERIPHLLRVPAAVRFLSVEPMLGPVDLSAHLTRFVPSGVEYGRGANRTDVGHSERAIDWVICGGESGGDSRPFDISWARSIVAQCREAKVACFVKQLGRIVLADPSSFYAEGGHPLHSTWSQDGKVVGYDFCGRGHHGDLEGWPLDLRVRELPVLQRE